jgi:hypothetical protein
LKSSHDEREIQIIAKKREIVKELINRKRLSTKDLVTTKEIGKKITVNKNSAIPTPSRFSR